MSQFYQDGNAFYRQVGYNQSYYNPAMQQPMAGPTGAGQAATGMPPGTYGGGPQIQPMQPMFPPMPAGSPLSSPNQGPAFTGIANAPSAGPPAAGMIPPEQSYMENILRLNKGKLVTVYTTFSKQEGLVNVFKGVIEAAGRDHLILNDPQTGQRYLIPMPFFAYATFDEELEYEYPGFVPGMSSFPSR